MFPTVRNEEVDLAVLNCQNKHIVVDDNFPIEKMIELIKVNPNQLIPGNFR